jgi:hypothetical protein
MCRQNIRTRWKERRGDEIPCTPITPFLCPVSFLHLTTLEHSAVIWVVFRHFDSLGPVFFQPPSLSRITAVFSRLVTSPAAWNLHKTLSWSVRKATQAAQKRPANWEAQCEKSFFRKAYIIKERDIPLCQL